MKNKFKFFEIIVILAVIAISGCSSPVGGLSEFNPLGNPGDNVSNILNANKYIISPVENGHRIDYSYTDGLNDYYFIYLGAVDNVPVSSQTPVHYDGRSRPTVSFTTSMVTKQAIEQQDSFTIATTVQETVTHTNTAKITSEIKIPFGPKIEAGYEYTNVRQRQEGRYHSTTSTFTSYQSWEQRNSQTFTFTPGNNGEPAGYYRISLFATTDIYVLIIRDRITGNYLYELSSFARPDSFFIAIEYSAINDFSAGSISNRIQFNSNIINSLPTVTDEHPAGMRIYNYSARTDLNVGLIRIPADINEVIFIGNNPRVFDMSIYIEARNQDLKFTFDNMQFRPSANRHAIDGFEYSSNDNVSIVLRGNNSITGRNGTTPSSGEGGNATDAINIHSNLIISGAGNLTLTGGNGGNGVGFTSSNSGIWQRRGGYEGGTGGTGLVTTGDVSFETSGNITINGGRGGTGTPVSGTGSNFGGNGNNGGFGIYVPGKTISFKEASGDISIRGGNGGNGGNATGGVMMNIGGNGGNGGHALVRRDVVLSDYMIRPVTLTGGSGGTRGTGSNMNGTAGSDGVREDIR